jgi:hypothetical protein
MGASDRYIQERRYGSIIERIIIINYNKRQRQ